MPNTELLREHVYNNITQGCECELFAAKSPTMTKEEWAQHVTELLTKASTVPTTRTREQLSSIEGTRMSMGALLDSLSPGEASSRLGQRLDELHSELSAGLKELRGDTSVRYHYRATITGSRGGPFDLDRIEVVGQALDNGWLVERQLAGAWEPTEEMPTAGQFA